jgi:antirestriction protein ArdC
VTERIIELLEQGTVPWRNPYTAKVGFPRNFDTGKAYRGINVFLLASMRYASPWWVTFKQAQALGGHVRKGEKGAMVIKYGTFQPKDDDGQEQERDDENGSRERGYLKAYTVFHASQVEGIEFPEPETPPQTTEAQRIESAEAIVQGMPHRPTLNIGRKAVACYSPRTDTVEMPKPEHFTSMNEYYLALFHELTHSTGHQSRLARKTLLENKGMLGGDKRTYSQEELVAEMGAAYLSAHAGLPGDDHENSAAYLQEWLKVLKVKENRKWIVQAASQAQKASDYVLEVPPIE